MIEKQIKPGNRRLKLDGKKFGRLTVLKFYDIRTRKGNKKESRWLCKCDCGNETVVVGSSLKSGKTQSCGCLNKETTKAASITHGLSHEKLYFVWKAMIARCENKEHPSYKDYGGRGISVCKEWHSIETFVNWSKENGHKEGLELDRINNNGNYEPTNCRFTTRKKQTRNTRRNINVTIGEQTKTLTEWAEIYSLKRNTMQYRYYRGDRGKTLVRPTEANYKSVKEGDARC